MSTITTGWDAGVTALWQTGDNLRMNAAEAERLALLAVEQIEALREQYPDDWTVKARDDLSGVFKGAPTDARQIIGDALAKVGLSTRAAAPILGVGKSTVERDRQVSHDGTPEAKVTGLDGKAYDATRESLCPDEVNRIDFLLERLRQDSEKMATALTTIRDNRLYRETHATFEDYCRDHEMWPGQFAELLHDYDLDEFVKLEREIEAADAEYEAAVAKLQALKAEREALVQP